MGQPWTATLRVVDIVERLPEFVSDYNRQLNEGTLVLVGNYYLGEKYDLSVLESAAIYTKKVREKVMVDNKEKEINRLLLVSDLCFCLFDQERWNKNNLHLVFWSNIRSLITIKKIIKGNTMRFFWKQKNKKVSLLFNIQKSYEMVLVVENDSDALVDVMLDRMSRFGINYKVSKQNNEPKTGVIPKTDIETVESTIAELEAEVEQDPEMTKVEYLMNLYAKAVEYYSATNNPKYEVYKDKIHNTLVTPRMSEFLDTEGSRIEDDVEDVNNQVEPVIEGDNEHDYEDIRLVKRNSKDLNKAQKYKLSDDYTKENSENNNLVSEVKVDQVIAVKEAELPSDNVMPKTDEDKNVESNEKIISAEQPQNEINKEEEEEHDDGFGDYLKQVEQANTPRSHRRETGEEVPEALEETKPLEESKPQLVILEPKEEEIKVEEQLEQSKEEPKVQEVVPNPKEGEVKEVDQPEQPKKEPIPQVVIPDLKEEEVKIEEQPEQAKEEPKPILEEPKLKEDNKTQEIKKEQNNQVKIELAEDEDIKIDYNDEEDLDDDDEE
jgi:hypothetical protein